MPEWEPLWRLTFERDIAFVAADSQARDGFLGRALPFTSDLLVGAGSSKLTALVDAAGKAQTAVRTSKSAPPHHSIRGIASGVHPGVSCDKSGECPLRGWRHHRVGTDYDLSQAEFDKLDEAERVGFERMPPTVYPRCAPTDDDDGLLTVVLPGTRRAIALLLRAVGEGEYENDDCDQFDDDDERVFSQVRTCMGRARPRAGIGRAIGARAPGRAALARARTVPPCRSPHARAPRHLPSARAAARSRRRD